MELKVNNDFRVQNDDCYFTVQKRRTILKSKFPEKVGTDVWENQTYHVNLVDANKSMLDKGIAMSDDWNSVIALLKDVKRQLDEQG